MFGAVYSSHSFHKFDFFQCRDEFIFSRHFIYFMRVYNELYVCCIIRIVNFAGLIFRQNVYDYVINRMGFPQAQEFEETEGRFAIAHRFG